MVPWVECPHIEIDLDLPPDRRYAAVPPAELARGARLLRAIMAEIPGKARYLADGARLRTRGRFHDEARALAQQVGTDWRSVMLANLTYDLTLAVFGCSTVALATPAGPVLARNMDFWPEDTLAQTSALVRLRRAGELQLGNAGWPGTIGVVTGMSGRGIAVALNAVSGPEGVSWTGYPVLLFIRKVLDDARDFAEAVHLLSRQKLAAPCLLTVVGTANDERVVIERSPTRFAERRPDGDAPLFVTNDYRKLFAPVTRDDSEIYRTTCDRFDRLCTLLAGFRGDREVADEELLYLLTDSEVIQGITAQHIIMRPAAGAMRMFVPRRFVPDGFF
ncbi:MAG TPA: C45 family autoproteolytic acyltransferase/hydrolase [Phycisphaerae bacterium]|nr:hypothetical protein [Phycisphaerales bacterium]HRX83944.1 C45 family autoproteolytic acyltransferase/hydrolase [Phycisphaerae bacterium]